VVRFMQGEPLEKTLAWAETEVEGFMRTWRRSRCCAPPTRRMAAPPRAAAGSFAGWGRPLPLMIDATCPGCGAARNEVQRCAADPGPLQTV